MISDLEQLADRLAVELADHDVAPLVEQLVEVVGTIAEKIRAAEVTITQGAAPVLAELVGELRQGGRLIAMHGRPSA